MAKKRYTHKQIRKSMKKDELRDMLSRVTASLRGNTENLLITLIIIVVIAILIPLYFRHQEDNERRANNLYIRAQNAMRQPVSAGSEGGQTMFRTTEEKYKMNQQAFSEISGAYRNTRSAKLARLDEANALFLSKEYAKALAVFQLELTKHIGSLLEPTILYRVGICQENLGKWEEALNTYQGVLQDHPNYFNLPAVRVAMARCQRQLGKIQEAQALLKTVESQPETNSYWKEWVRQRMVFESAK